MTGPDTTSPAPVAFVLAWTLLGAIAGAVMLVPAGRSMRRVSLNSAPAAASVVVTGVVFALLAARFGPSMAIGSGTALAVVGPALTVVDIAERRLPSALLVPGFVLTGSAVLILAATSGSPALIGTAVLMSTTLAACYLALAIISGGGLGAGDVKLAALTGLALANTGWWSILVATAATWVSAALAAAFQRVRWRGRADGAIPLGPSLVFGAMLGVLDVGSWNLFP